MRIRPSLAAILSLCGAASCGGGGGGGSGAIPVFPIPFASVTFSGHAIDNPLYPLVSGRTHIYEALTADGLEHETVAVTNQTKVILGVTCVVVHQTALLDGSLIEDTLDWYAQDDSGNVWYFGEDTKSYSGGLLTGTKGSWEAGVNGAQAGIQMLASPALSDFYSQEFLAGVAEDLGYVFGTGETVNIALGTFTGCLHTRDTSTLEPDVVENKFYAPGIGTILEIDEDGVHHELISVTP